MPKQWEHHSLQRFLDCNPKSLLRVLEIYVADKPQVSQTCTKDTAEIFIKLVQEHFLSETLVPDDARTVLHAIQHICTYEDHTEGLPVLIAHGLLNKVVKHFTSKITYEPGDEYGDLYDEVLETISSIADHSTDAKGKAVEAFGSVLLSILTSEKLSFLIRIEALKTLNILLVHCPWPIRDRFRDTPSHIKYIHKLGYLIPQIGDYEFQVGIIECLFRLTNKSNRAEFAAKWFTKGVQAATFVKIRDSEFETDCRTFLNGLNKSESNRVYTVPCLSVRLGTYEVKKPDDPNYSQFWVDFNDGSKRISIFCCQDPTESQENEIDGMWETVSIFETNLVSYRLDKVGKSVKLSALLHKNVRDLINFGPQFEDKRVQITFPGTIDVHTPVKRIFGLQKMTVDNQSCTQSTMTPSLHFEDSQGRHKAKKRKVSVPAEPMRTPTNRCIQQAGRAYPPIPMQPTPTRNTPNGQKSTKQDPSNTNTETREVSARRAAPVHTKPTRKVPENPIALPEHVQRGPLFSPTKAAKASIAAVAVKVRQSSDEVIPSSCPTENGVVIPDSQGKGIPLMPIPSETEIQEPNQMDVDHSDSDECDRSALKAGKKGKMAALKDYLQKTDPSYTSLPTNVHKVSNTPALSTVSEESAKTTPGRPTASASVSLGCIQEDEEGSLPRSQKSQTGSESVISASQNSNSNTTAAKRGKKSKVVSKKSTVQPQRRSQRGRNKEEQDQFSQRSVDVVEDSQKAEPLKASSMKVREKPASPEFKEPMTNKRNKKESVKPKLNDSSGARTKGILKDTSRTERKTTPRDKTPEPTVSEVSRKDSPEISSGGSQESEIIESSQYNLCKSAGIGNITHPAGMPPKEPKFFKARYRERMASQNPQFWSPRSCLTNRAATPTKQKSPIRAHTQSVRDKTPVKQKTLGTKDNNIYKYNRFSEIHSKDSAPLSSIGSPVTESQDVHLIHRKAPTPKLQSKEVKSPPRPQPPEVEPEEVYEFEPSVPMPVNKKSSNKRQVKKNEVQKNVSRTDTPSKSVHFGRGQNKAQNKNTSRLLVDEARSSSSHKPAAGKSKANSKPGKTKSQENESKLAKRRRQALLSDEERFNTEEQESHQISRGRDKTSDDEDDCVADMMELTLNILGGSRKEGTQRRKPKPVNYKEISDAESVEEFVPKKDTPLPKPARRASFDPYIMEPSTSLQNRRSAKKAKTHKSIFSETEDNMSVRSEVSWLGSTARKKKERPPPKAYTKKRGIPAKPQLVVAGKEDADDEWSADERHYNKQPTKKARKEPVKKKAKKPKVESPRVTEDDNSDDDLYYAAPARPCTDSDKENKKGKAPRRVPKEAEVKCAEETPSCQEKQPRSQKQRRGQPLRTIATPNTPLETDFGSIEKMRYQENEATPYLVVESPYMPTHVSLTGLEERLVDFPNLDDTDRAVELASPMSAVTHISSLKTPQTQRIAEDLSENEEEDQISLFKINMPVLEDVKSGPRKRKRSVEHKTAPSPVSSLDKIENIQVADPDEEEEEDPRVANLSKFGTSLLKTLQPRRLFNKNAQGSEKGKRKRKQESETEEEADEEDEENEEEPAEQVEEEADSDHADMTTPREEEDEDLDLPGHLGPDDTLPVHSLLQSFNKDIQRTMLVKRKRLEALTKGAVSSTQKKLSSIWHQQNVDRNEFIRTFQGIFLEEIANLERDVSKIRNIETDCMTFYQKQLDALRRCQTSHGTRFQRFKKMEMSFVNGFGNLEKEQQSGKAVVKDALKKEIQALHKRLVQEKQQEELANMRKSLHSMFF